MTRLSYFIPGLVCPSMVEPSTAGSDIGSLIARILAVELGDSCRGVGFWGGSITVSAAEVIRGLC